MILVTGGTGFIGSHTAVLLVESGYEVVVVDNFVNSSPKVLQRLQKLAGRPVLFEKLDLRNEKALEWLFSKYDFDAVIHFAGLKAVGESVKKPLYYYENNIGSTLVLCKVMEKFGVSKLVFSSSATVYGAPELVPIVENTPLHSTNPYGRTKLMIEEILKDMYIANTNWRIALLRYFNPIGAHESGEIGEDPNGVPNNLMPYITQVAIGKLEKLYVFGNNYQTVDGTGVRDYIHVTDLAYGHIKALDKLNQSVGIEAYNLGTGRGYSVLEVIKTFERVTGVSVPYQFMGRRLGDIAECYADPSKANKELGWKAEKTLEDMCRDSWRWQKKNPNGFA